MNDFVAWPWHDSLAGVPAERGSSYRIRRIVFGPVRDHCESMGLKEGDTIRCRDRRYDGIEVALPSGGVGTVDLTYAWFIEVESTPAGG